MIHQHLSYKHNAPGGASADYKFFALRAQCGRDVRAPSVYVSFFLNASFNPVCAWSWAS